MKNYYDGSNRPCYALGLHQAPAAIIMTALLAWGSFSTGLVAKCSEPDQETDQPGLGYRSPTPILQLGGVFFIHSDPVLDYTVHRITTKHRDALFERGTPVSFSFVSNEAGGGRGAVSYVTYVTNDLAASPSNGLTSKGDAGLSGGMYGVTGVAGQSGHLFRDGKPNEITTVRLTYSGIVVEAVRRKNPFQLINPAAPAEYGLAEDNVLRDPIDGKVTGLKIFSIKF